jgi:hypothetical protein
MREMVRVAIGVAAAAKIGEGSDRSSSVWARTAKGITWAMCLGRMLM